MAPDGTGRKSLTDTPVGGEQQPAWNATAKKLVFTDSGHSFATMRSDGTQRKPLVSMDTFAENPTWSPDGTTVAFDHYISATEGQRIYVVPAAGGPATELADVRAQDPTYSPDGTKIAFELFNGSTHDIGVMNANGSSPVSITTGESGNNGDYDPSWSPDGTKIVFKRNYQIWTVNTNGSGATQLTTGDTDEYPTWSPDGTKIAYVSDEDIWVMDADGTDQVNITNTPDIEERHPDWGYGGALGPSEGIQFQEDAYEVDEGAGDAVITVERTGGSEGTATMRFTTSDGSVKSSITRPCLRCPLPRPDYLNASGTIVFGDGETEQTLRVPIIDDGEIEQDETVRITLVRSRNGQLPAPRSTATLTIHDNDPNVSFATRPTSVSEENATPNFQVLLSSSTPNVSVDYEVTGGTATASQDFTLAAGTLNIGARGARLPITINDDNLKEPTETVIVELSAPTNAQLGPRPTQTFSIKDNDPFGDVAGDTPGTALEVDLVEQPRQTLRENLNPGEGDSVDVYRVHLESGDDLAIDVDPGRPELGSSTLRIIGPDTTSELAVVGPSREPDGSGMTDNPAHLFTAPAAGDYYLSLSGATRLAGYSLKLHRLALAEGAQDPASLDEEGPMFAWLRGTTLGITGPTGYGFALEGAWVETTETHARNRTSSSTYTLAAGEAVSLVTAFGDLELQSIGEIVVPTQPNVWGDTFGEVAVESIPVRMGIPLGALTDTLQDDFGLDFTVSALERWTIALGSDIAEGVGGGRGSLPPPKQAMPGIPYLLFHDKPTVAAAFGDIRIEQAAADQRLMLVLDPTDPSLFIRGEDYEGVKKPTLAFSRRGYYPFHPDLEPTIDTPGGLTEFYSHLFASGGVPPNPALAEYFTIEADGSIDLDANDDATWLAGQGNADALMKGDLSAFGPVLKDINLGANGRVIFHYNSKRFDFETPLGRATAVFNGQEEALWFRGRSLIEESPLDGTPLSFLSMRPEDFIEGTINSDGTFFVTGGTRVNLPGDGLLLIQIDLHNEGIDAEVSGKVELKGSVKISGAEAKCTATGGAGGSLSFTYSDRLHMSGSLGVDGSVKCYVGGKKVASASFDLSAQIDDGKLVFKLPIIGAKSVTLF